MTRMHTKLKQQSGTKKIRPLNILAVSDVEQPQIYSSKILKLFSEIDLVISCGDLNHYYLEYIISMLDIPLYYVNGNHTPAQEYGTGEPRFNPWGAIDIHKQVIYNKENDLILAGIEGCLKYNKGRHQYSQLDMWLLVVGLIPKLLLNKFFHGRFLDIFVTHAPSWKINDDTDRAHQGIKAFRWLVKTFKPKYHIHGHIHQYKSGIRKPFRFKDTQVINAYGYQRLSMPE